MTFAIPLHIMTKNSRARSKMNYSIFAKKSRTVQVDFIIPCCSYTQLALPQVIMVLLFAATPSVPMTALLTNEWVIKPWQRKWRA